MSSRGRRHAARLRSRYGVMTPTNGTGRDRQDTARRVRALPGCADNLFRWPHSRFNWTGNFSQTENLGHKPLDKQSMYVYLVRTVPRDWATGTIHHLKLVPAVGAAGFGPGPGRGKGYRGDGHALRGDVFETETARRVETAQSFGTVPISSPRRKSCNFHSNQSQPKLLRSNRGAERWDSHASYDCHNEQPNFRSVERDPAVLCPPFASTEVT